MFAASIRDLSERKEMEKALLQLAAIVGSTDVAVIGKTLNGADRAASLTQQLLSLSGTESRRPRVVDLSAVVTAQE